jgi:hypothetical protein
MSDSAIGSAQASSAPSATNRVSTKLSTLPVNVFAVAFDCCDVIHKTD